MINHPLPLGTYVLSIEGEWDSDDDGDERRTGPMAIGRICNVDFYDHQLWTYGVVFPNGTWVFIDQNDSIDDPKKYRVFDASVILNLT